MLQLLNGQQVVRSGGTLAWRNNNPGNLRNTAFSTRRGSLGEAHGFAVFAAEPVGERALVSLLNTSTYQELSLDAAIARYAPANENDTANYQRLVQSMTGLSGNTLLSSLTEDQVNAFAQAIRRIEGWREGNVTIRRPEDR